MDLKSKIRSIEDFPKPGISFKDITTLLQDGGAYRAAIDGLADHFSGRGIEVVTGPESRGFIFAAAVAYRLGCGLVPIRKPGKLPFETRKVTYSLEYGQDSLADHVYAFHKGQKALVVDDLLATGGTMKATIDLVESLGARVEGIGFLIELTFLNGRERLQGYDIFSLVQY